ncbi:hypothetical protein L5515_018490, partial [Caenorhabditis briggsae]
MSSDNPDSDRKLSYDCLKCVTQKFEANFRFRLAESLPKIQWADKAVPLFISKLTICEEGHKLNDTDYRLGVICHTCNGYAPKTIICGNQYGHLRDIDRFRFEKRLFPEFTPGDIFVQDFNPQRGVDDDLELAITEASFMMEHDRLTALEKFTKVFSDGTVHIERFNYDKSLMEAWRYLICKTLGNRKSINKIESLGFQKHDGLVVCLPEGIKLNVRNFATSGNLSEVLQRVEPMLESPNRPFGRLTSDVVRQLGCQLLCREIQNKKIVISLGQQMQPEQYGVLVQNLIDAKGTLGTYYEITQPGEKETRIGMRVISNRYDNAVMGERVLILLADLQEAIEILGQHNMFIFAAAFQQNTLIMSTTAAEQPVLEVLNQNADKPKKKFQVVPVPGEFTRGRWKVIDTRFGSAMGIFGNYPPEDEYKMISVVRNNVITVRKKFRRHPPLPEDATTKEADSIRVLQKSQPR